MSFYNTKNFSYLLNRNSSIVITGDSLAYNRYDFVEEPRMNAWDCPFAMPSWSFLLRDYLITHSKGWTSADKVNILIKQPTNSKKIIKGDLIKKYDQSLPLKDRLPIDAVSFEITAPEISMHIKGCPKNLCFITNSKDAFLESDGLRYDLKGKPELFSGSYYKWVNSKTGILENIKEGSLLKFVGASEVQTEVFLTGSGSKTAEWLLENSYERIFKYEPDLVIMIIGANNRRMKNPDSFKSALNKLIETSKINNTEIIFISPPHSTTTDPEWGVKNIYFPDTEVTKPIMDILSKAASDNEIPFLDLFEFFSGTPNETWRYDNTHFTKQGNLILYKAIINSYFKE